MLSNRKLFKLVLILLLALSLRLFNFGKNPPSLSEDEASLGYNSYTILTAGKGEHGEVFPLDKFIAFGDYKPPGYIYAAVPSIAVFGLNEIGVRLPSLISGVLLSLVAYLLVIEMFGNPSIALLSAFLIAVSPWSIQFSRAAFESNLAALLNATAVLFFIKSRKKGFFLPLSVILFILAFYTFNANRIISPILLFTLELLFLKDFIKNIKWIIISVFIGIIMLLPSYSFLSSRESKVRFQEVSIFSYDIDKLKLSNERISTDGNSIIGKIFHNRRLVFSLDFLKHYTDNFDPKFLFLRGDGNQRLSVPGIGEMFVWEIIFYTIGIFYLLRNPNRNNLLLLLWFLIVPLPAGTAKETPHALRIASILPVPQIFSALGIWQVSLFIRKSYPRIKIYFPLLLLPVFIFNFYYYLHNYFVHYPVEFSRAWQYGYKEMTQKIKERENNYDHVLVSRSGGRSYIYFLFYNGYPVSDYLRNRIATRDWWGLWDVASFGKYYFDLKYRSELKGKILVAEGADELVSGEKVLDTISYPKGDPAYKIVEITR